MKQNQCLLIIPGYQDSGPAHWQTLWQRKTGVDIYRFVGVDWESPELDQWVNELDNQIKLCPTPPVLVAHSLGCLAVIEWSQRFKTKIAAAFLVAPPNARRSDFPREIKNFDKILFKKLPFKTLLVVSDNDHYADLEYSQNCASAWGAELVVIPQGGHLNANSNLGDWDAGWKLLTEMMEI